MRIPSRFPPKGSSGCDNDARVNASLAVRGGRALRAHDMRLDFPIALQLQTVAIDDVYRQGQPVVGEVSYTYASSGFESAPVIGCS